MAYAPRPVNMDVWDIVKDVWNQLLASEDYDTILTPDKSYVKQRLKQQPEMRHVLGACRNVAILVAIVSC